ncbi:MAG TPA: type III secretion inner membrane ring lipoprotein SctJ [Chthoniobacterales bacterium]|nr:type III secretion inner membrane ring lipoprotein SctJ [Chthoniobacterales bacterium]
MRYIKSLITIPPWRVIAKMGLILLSSLILSGCGPEALYSNLSETDANTMMGLLLSRNIEAVKMGQKGLFTISVPRHQFAAATDLLKWYGIPGEKFSGIGEVFKKTGIVSSPSEEKIRFMYALSQEIAETLSHFDGVLIARVSLVLPKNDPYTETLTPSSASVFLKFRPGLVPPTLIPQIKTLVMKSVEGLNYDNISVVIAQSESIDYYYPLNTSQRDYASFFGVKIPKSALWKIVFIMVGMILLTSALILGGFFAKQFLVDHWQHTSYFQKTKGTQEIGKTVVVTPSTAPQVTIPPEQIASSSPVTAVPPES